jgi:hypothetical protein
VIVIPFHKRAKRKPVSRKINRAGRRRGGHRD